MHGVAQGACQLLAGVPLGSKLQDLQGEGHAGRRDDKVGPVSTCCYAPVEAKCKLSLQHQQALGEEAVLSREAGVKEEEGYK